MDTKLNKGILPGAFGAAARHTVNVSVCVLMIPFIISHLGTEDFGLWVLIHSTIGILALCDAGLTTSTVKFVADCRGQGDIDRRNRLVSTVLCLYCIAALVTVTIAILLGTCFQAIFSIPESLHAKAFVVFAVIAGKQVLTFPLSIFHGVLYGERRIGMVNIVRLGSTVCYALLTWVVLSAGQGIIALAGVNLLAFLLESIAYAWLCKRHIQRLELSVRLLDVNAVREVASFSGYALLANLAVLALFRLDPIVVKLFLPMTAVALYALALKISEQIMLVVKQFINVFAPAQAEVCSHQSTRDVAKNWLDCTQWAMAGAAMLSIAITVCAEDVLTLWIGPEFSEAAPLVIILLMAVVVGVGQECASSSLAMIGYHRFNSLAVVFSAIVNVALSVVLIQFYGLIGVAIATLVSSMTVGVGVVITKMLTVCNVSWSQLFRSSVWPWLIPASCQLVVTWGVRSHWKPENLGELALVLLPGIGVFVLLSCFFMLSTDERKRLMIACRGMKRLSPFLRPIS